MTDYIIYFILIQLVLLIPLIYLFRLFFRKVRFNHVNAYSYFTSILFAILFTCLFVIINSNYIHPWIRSEKFNSGKWKNEERLRYRMVNDIIDNNLLIGMTKEEVITILGEGGEEGPCNDCIGYSTNEPEQGFSIDHEVLEIVFDKQIKVASVRLNAW
jgi:hypothetical protein